MNHLVTTTPQNVPVAPDQLAALYEAAKQWLKVRLDDGTFDCHYVFSDRGGFTIVNVSSHEEIFDQITDFPTNAFFTREVKDLCDWNHSYDSVIKSLKQAAQQ